MIKSAVLKAGCCRDEMVLSYVGIFGQGKNATAVKLDGKEVQFYYDQEAKVGVDSNVTLRTFSDFFLSSKLYI